MPPRGWIKKHRVEAFQSPRPPLWRRILRLIFNPLTFAVALLGLLVCFLTGTYFWFEYSDRIELLLQGEVFTNTAGIYSAPKTLRTGENITPEELITYLKSAGYVEKQARADASRSRYEFGENKLEVEPGTAAYIGGEKKFPALTVDFKKDGKQIEKITNDDESTEVKNAQIEPEILSSIAAEGDGIRKTVKFNDLPPHLVKAITTTEDRAFFEHHGVNLRGIARALWRRYDKENDDSPLANQGGSSITQQLVKNLLLTREQTLERKAKEAYMSVILETRLSKEDIFALYANQIYLGQNTGVSIYGVGEASNVYFGKDVSQINLAEAAFIAGIIRSPNRYNPYKRPEKVKERRNQVLQSMLETGEIDGKQYEQASNTPIELRKITSKEDLRGMPYFTQYAVEEVPKIISDPEALQKMRFYTTIDPDLQQIAYETVNKRLAKLDKYFKSKDQKPQAGLIAIEAKTGEIVAMVGGRNFLENQFNRATDAMRQPGSSFKPFVYAQAINSAYEMNSRVFTAATIFKDEKKVFNFGNDTYAPNNYGDYFSNEDITLRDALVKSKNTITVDLGMQLNIGKVMNLAYRAGLPKVEKAYPSMALGTSEATPLQVATGYTIFANLGDRVSPIAINRVTDGNGKIITEPTGEKKNIIHPDVAYIVTDILKDVINRGTAAGAKAWGFKNVPGKTGIAGKTGTSRDGWFAGFTPELICVVYVGFDENHELGMKGSDSAMPIWADFMKAALDLHPEWNGDWQMPTTVQQAEIDTRNGKLIREMNGTEVEDVKAEQSKTPEQIPNSFEIPETKNIYVTEVPNEFRRVELFVTGTAPNKVLLPSDSENLLEDENIINPAVTPTPFTTWAEAEKDRQNSSNSNTQKKDSEEKNVPKEITLMICDLTGMRATRNCRNMSPKTFRKGEEPKEFCTFHVKPPD